MTQKEKVIMNRIKLAKNELSHSDYISQKIFEKLIVSDGFKAFIYSLEDAVESRKLIEKYSAQLKNREKIREKIRNLESSIKGE